LLISLLVLIATAYAFSSIQSSLPRRLSSKLSARLADIDYTHSNSSRIAAEVRRALKYPADTLRVQLKRNCEKLQANKEETEQVRRETESARKFFASLVRTAGEISASVRGIDLEGVVAGQQQAVGGAIGANL
jgi:mitofusin 2